MVSPVRSELRLLAALAAVVFVILLSNVTTLVLLRAERLQVEVAVIRALGATNGDVRRRFISETGILGIAGGLLRSGGLRESPVPLRRWSFRRRRRGSICIRPSRHPAPTVASSRRWRYNVVTARFFSVMGIPIRTGREFRAGDLISSTPGVVLSAALLHDLFGDESPIGRTVRYTTGKLPPYTVVGVSGDVFSDRVADGPLRLIYFPLLDELPPTSKEAEDRIPVMPGGMHFIVRSALPLDALVPTFRAATRSVDSRVPVWDIRSLDDVVAATTASLRLTMLLLGAAAAATLLLGAIGIYSVVAYTTAGRSPELAVRLALGASPPQLVWMVYRESFVMAGVGIAIGLLLSIAGARIVRGLLYEVKVFPSAPGTGWTDFHGVPRCTRNYFPRCARDGLIQAACPGAQGGTYAPIRV